MSKVVRVSDELYEKILRMKLEMKLKNLKKPSLWNTNMSDWDIKLVYNPKKKKK